MAWCNNCCSAKTPFNNRNTASGTIVTAKFLHADHCCCFHASSNIPALLFVQEHQRAEAAAREHVIAEIHRRAARQTATWAAAQQLAITWLQVSVNAEDADYVQHHMGVIKGILSDADLLSSAATAVDTDAAVSGQVTESAAPMNVDTVANVPLQLAESANAHSVAIAQCDDDRLKASAAKAVAVDQATAVANAAAVTASLANASAAQAAASSAAAVAAMEVAAGDSTAPAVAVAFAIDEAARALAEAKAKATATAEAAWQAAMASEQQKVLKRANEQLFSPLTQGLVDYPSDEDSHMSRGMSGDTAAVSGSRGTAAKSNLAPKTKAMTGLSLLLPMYSADLSGTGGTAAAAQRHSFNLAMFTVSSG